MYKICTTQERGGKRLSMHMLETGVLVATQSQKCHVGSCAVREAGLHGLFMQFVYAFCFGTNGYAIVRAACQQSIPDTYTIHIPVQ